jgi:hypothetical protein
MLKLAALLMFVLAAPAAAQSRQVSCVNVPQSADDEDSWYHSPPCDDADDIGFLDQDSRLHFYPRITLNELKLIVSNKFFEDYPPAFLPLPGFCIQIPRELHLNDWFHFPPCNRLTDVGHIDRPRHIKWFPNVTMARMEYAIAYIVAEHVAVDIPLGDYPEYLGVWEPYVR